MLNLYNERSGVLDGDDDGEVDLASYAYRIWKEAIERDPSLQKTIPDLPACCLLHTAAFPSPRPPGGRTGLHAVAVPTMMRSSGSIAMGTP